MYIRIYTHTHTHVSYVQCALMGANARGPSCIIPLTIQFIIADSAPCPLKSTNSNLNFLYNTTYLITLYNTI